ncbi:hypothetical protein TNCV_3148241 [Trichonephila clavipes]|nr:hypothetical protein TNCV_3148241 [Trichonephila clavipes]
MTTEKRARRDFQRHRFLYPTRPTNHCLFNTSRLYRISAPSTAPPVLTSKNEKGLFPRLLKESPHPWRQTEKSAKPEQDGAKPEQDGDRQWWQGNIVG